VFNISKKVNEKERIRAYELAREQREISVSQFFAKNRHLLGFDNPVRALLTTVKELVDNSLDACDDMRVLPEIKVQIISASDNRYRVVVEDNGPGIVKQQIPNIFAKLLYGSKFFKLRQSITADEPIMIQRDGKIEIIPIGELVDSYIPVGEGVKKVDNIYVPAFDKNKYSYKFRKISHVIKHKRRNEIIKIKTATNRTIKVTGCHSLFTEENGVIKEIEARKLKIGSKIIVPSKLPEISNLKYINILNYLSLNDVEDNRLYVYNIPNEILTYIRTNSRIIYKKISSKVRKFYRINGVDILDESLKQYERKKFLPLPLIFKLNMIDKVKDCIIKSYFHGKETIVPVTLPLLKEFIRFLGLYIAEGHIDKRQLGLTFGKHEDDLVNEVINFARIFGLNFTIENREKTIRIKLFGNIFVKLIENICGNNSWNKKIPEFIFKLNKELRQEFLDALYQGDGHNTKNRNQLMLSTVNKRLANEVLYLWLMQGVLASLHERITKGFRQFPTKSYVVSLYGSDIEKSNLFFCNANKRSKRVAQQVLQTELSTLKIKNIEIINKGYDYVYDISVPECENFVGGIGGISCHNSRGQQGIGVSASVLYGQLTTGKSVKITSKIDSKKPAYYYELHINTAKNEPEILKEDIIKWDKDHGTKVEIELEGNYKFGARYIESYLKQTAMVNPHLKLIYIGPNKEKKVFQRITSELPIEPKSIKPHPHGIELGVLMNMLKNTKARTIQSFLTNDFCRVGVKTAKSICDKAGINANARPKRIARQDVDNLLQAIKKTKLIAPPTDCLSPIGSDLLEKSLKKEVNADFFVAVTRPPSVYRGMPFQIEAAIAYGGDLKKDNNVTIMRFANKVPLLYQQGACAITKSIQQIKWRSYGLQQSGNSIPVGPAILLVHIASVWVPFTSESKEAIAHYPEIIKEIKLALQECGRKLAGFIRKKIREYEVLKKKSYIEKYLPHIGIALKDILRLKKIEQEKIIKALKNILEGKK